MSLILNIETATTVCSVALGRGDSVVGSVELDEGYTHAENLHVFIGRLLGECGVRPVDLRAVAVSRGPGSYTGLRIGCSAAKGLAFSLSIPLISVDTLQTMAAMALQAAPGAQVYRPMIDARRMEVYTAAYDGALSRIDDVRALVIDGESARTFGEGPVCFFGNGYAKCRDTLSQLPGARFVDGIVPLARHMVASSFRYFNEQRFEDVAAFEPLYLKDFLIKARKTT